LGAVDQEYDVAISTNFTQLEYIVVDNIETAQNCIQLLKKEELGTQTFIALDKQQNFWPNIRTVPKTPENTPRIFDLIRVNDEQVNKLFANCNNNKPFTNSKGIASILLRVW
jgi:structural maintenance of chromosome 4